MNLSLISNKDLIKAFFLGLAIALLALFIQLSDKHTKIVFCDVGQGDAAYIRIKNKIDVVIDSGSNQDVLNCLGKHMPFWDKKIELAILSHHDIDHFGGFLYLIDRYQIDKFITIYYRFDSKSYKQLEDKLTKQRVEYKFTYQGRNINILNDSFRFYWPPLDLKSYDSNDYSLVFLFEEEGFRALFTGDASSKALTLLNRKAYINILSKINILKIPHHGSKNGLTRKFLDLADPRLVVISVGKNNSYGHPSKEVLDMLKAKNIVIKRTDEEGDVVFNLKESP